ncbi:MAG TPA: hypothetical protein VM146_05930 [Steroidobacteraceae bacterium]|nr:hypothetical protein [Steroidobacteraceae bacterium]
MFLHIYLRALADGRILLDAADVPSKTPAARELCWRATPSQAHADLLGEGLPEVERQGTDMADNRPGLR